MVNNASMRILWFAPLPVAMLAEARSTPAAPAIAFRRTRSSDQQFDELIAGTVDAVVTAMDNVVEWNRRAPSADFRVFAQMEEKTDLALFARPEIASLGALRGKRILVDAPDNGFVVALLAVLAQVGIARSEVTLVPSGGVTERLEALKSGSGDATLLGPPFDDAACGSGCVKLADICQIWPHFPGQGLVLARTNLDRLRPALLDWLSELTAARESLEAAPDAAISLLQATGMSEVQAARATALIPTDWVPDHESITLLIDHRRSVGLPGGNLDYVDLVDLSLLSETSICPRPGTKAH